MKRMAKDEPDIDFGNGRGLGATCRPFGDQGSVNFTNEE